LKHIVAKLPPGVDEMAFLPAILSAALPKLASDALPAAPVPDWGDD
jgi:hypothetical protein